MTAAPLTPDHPRVQLLARWLERAQLSNGQPCPLPTGGLTDLLAEAILARLDGWVWDPEAVEITDGRRGKWVSADMSGIVAANDVTVETLDESAVRMTHRPTGIIALDISHDAAFALLKRKVKEATSA